MRTHGVLGCIALLAASCTQAVDDDPESGTGSLTLALSANDSAGVAYRLRSADIDISGYPDGYYGGSGGWYGGYGGSGGGSSYFSERFSSEDYLDQATINVRLVPGYYNVALANSDWYLERTNDEGDWERVEQVVLLTSTYQSTYVWDGGTAYVSFRFGVDGELIDFRSGELQVGIEIEKPGERCVPGYGGYGGYGGYWGGMTCGVAGAGGSSSAGTGAGGAGGSAGASID